MSNTERFVDTGKLLTAFADEVLVTCIGCGAPGVVRATWSPYKWNAKFECSNCNLVLSSEAGHWVGAVRAAGRQPCGYCGHKWLTPTVAYEALPPEPPTQLAAECPECGRQTFVTATLTRALPEDRSCDPHFGLSLRLATSTRHGTVWAYNLRHLNELSGYVTAKLRVRQNSGNRAMFSRLPKWMKLAKHRDEIAKALCKLNAMA
ncbi:hypothetical protein EWH46_09520 [Sphaerotilus sulfidivorans]|uniref:Uncharacterized protein n=1 Tax=Sphaerotilus sulfidivorans TaxID=639200 RepID=A0A5C1Q0H7_9BURK|nr:hypothetical protein EWH46_09520 [Sphaerotilus sulfidivorans]